MPAICIAAWVTDDHTARPHSTLGFRTPAGFALHLTTRIAPPAARDESSARRAIAQTAPKGLNDQWAPVLDGLKFSGRSARHEADSRPLTRQTWADKVSNIQSA